MRPKLGSIFPNITDDEIKNLEVEKISLSKNRRQMSVLFGEGTSRYLMDKACAELKKSCSLSGIKADAVSGGKLEENNVMYYEAPENEEYSTAQTVRRTNRKVGRVNTGDMLYGRPIKGDVFSISSINENSGRVIVSGKVFSADEREITSKKTGKQFHLITMEYTLCAEARRSMTTMPRK